MCMFDPGNITDKQFRQEFLKHKIRKFTIECLKFRIKEKHKDGKFVEK